jgi:glycosyltransferase involved in cell wall biosynthesis
MNGRILGQVVVRNEAGRYLAESLAWQSEFCDEIHVYDDRSTDDTVDIAIESGATVTVRPERLPSFLTHEGKFRQASWKDFQAKCDPTYDDWIFAFDADEFLVSPNEPERDALERLAQMSKIERASSWKLRVDEIFDVVSGTPFKRTDGYWNQISAVRFFKYRSLSQFANRVMGCGSVPTYALQDPADARKMPVGIMHFGYAREADRQEKYDRYTSVLNNGHSSNHIKSILQLPTLEPVTHGRIPL